MANYYKIKKYNIANGEGIRTAIFFSGCNFRCKGCFNQQLWDCNAGYLFTDETQQEIFDTMNEHIAGLSILGGEPLSPEFNLSTVISLCKNFKQQFPNKTIWVWSGYRFEDLTDAQKEILPYIDVLVDGPFREELKEPNLQFRGSSNQRIIRIHECNF